MATMAKIRRGSIAGLLALVVAMTLASLPARSATDWITGLPRVPIHVAAWPGGKKVAVCFIFDVEVWGHGHGPNFRSDTANRDPDVVDEGFRQYANHWGVPRVAGLFKAEGLPVSI